MQQAPLKIYPRKEVAKWVEDEGKCKLEDLRNGAFLCQIISKVVRQPIKYNANPKSDFECEQNLSIFSKMLHKYKYTYDFDPQLVIQSKNHFSLANWLKNLSEGQIHPRPSIIETRPMSGMSAHRKDKASKNNKEISRFLSPNQKKSEHTAAMFGIPRLIQSPSLKAMERRNSAQKSARSRKELIIPNYQEEQYSNLMEEMALEDTIAGLESILQKVKDVISSGDSFSSCELYKQAINAAIFDRDLPLIP